MKKLIYFILAAFLVIFTTSTNFVHAEEKSSNDLTLEEEIINLAKSNLSEEEKKDKFLELVDEAPLEERQAYLESVEKTIKENLSNIQLTGDSNTLDLGNGISLLFQAGDDEYQTMGYSYSEGVTMTKKYGARRFTCKVSVKSVGITLGSLVLVNHYKVGDYGLKMTSADDTGTKGLEPLMVINSSSATITDAAAEKEGYDINAKGNYKWKLGIKGLYMSFTSEIYSTIKLKKLYKSNQSAYIYHNYKFTE